MSSRHAVHARPYGLPWLLFVMDQPLIYCGNIFFFKLIYWTFPVKLALGMYMYHRTQTDYMPPLVSVMARCREIIAWKQVQNHPLLLCFQWTIHGSWLAGCSWQVVIAELTLTTWPQASHPIDSFQIFKYHRDNIITLLGTLLGPFSISVSDLS